MLSGATPRSRARQHLEEPVVADPGAAVQIDDDRPSPADRVRIRYFLELTEADGSPLVGRRQRDHGAVECKLEVGAAAEE